MILKAVLHTGTENGLFMKVCKINGSGSKVRYMLQDNENVKVEHPHQRTDKLDKN